MSIAERIADQYVMTLDMKHLSRLQVYMLHAIKSVAVKQWARKTLEQAKQGKR